MGDQGYPNMSDIVWKSTSTSLDLGWIKGLHKIADDSLEKIYGNYSDFIIDDDFNIEFDTDTFTDNTGPIIYLAAWIAVLVVFAITGLCWCICNKCVCCCRSSFKGRSGRSVDELENTDPHYQLRPYYSERNASKSGGITVSAIVMSLLMVVWLVAFLIIILHTFAANGKTKEAVDNISPSLNDAADDLDNFVTQARKQLNYTFLHKLTELSDKIDDILLQCGIKCDIEHEGTTPRLTVLEALGNTTVQVNQSTALLDTALEEVQETVKEERENVEDDYEDVIDRANKGLYAFFMIFNLLYCLIFLLVLFGVVLAAFARGSGLKTGGFLIIRAGIVLIFVGGILVILQLVTMFALAGVATEIICPAIRGLETERSTVLSASITNYPPTQERFQITNGPIDGSYTVPSIGKVLRACKNDESSYVAFDLIQSYDIDDILSIREYFNFIDDLPPAQVPDELIQIRTAVIDYATFVRDSIKTEMGKCGPAYNVINATISLFCVKLTAPVASYWFILQFLIPVFILIFITAMFFERMHS